MNLDEEIEKARQVCLNLDMSNTKISLVERMKPWAHLQNLLLEKVYRLLKEHEKEEHEKDN